MQFARTIHAVDTHAGIPMRVITGGVPHIPGDSVYDKMNWLEKNDDQLRKLMLREPRGYPATSAKMAVLHAKGELALNQDFRHEGILNNIFTGRLVEETTIGNNKAVVPTISGRTWITGFNTLVLEPSDPMPEGFTVGDLWG